MKKILKKTAIFFIVIFSIYAFLPKPELNDQLVHSQLITDRDNQLLRISLSADDKYRLPVPLERVSKVMQQATLVYEDQYFYQHLGVNPVAVIRAAWQTYILGTRPIGASTITMQLARHRFKLNTRTVSGKLLQMFRAVQLERHYTKHDILEAYLNRVSYGANIEGVEAASQIYFDKPATRLTLQEAAILAVVPQNPSQRNPNNPLQYTRLSAAKERFLERYQSEYDLSAIQHSRALLSAKIRTTRQLPFAAPHTTSRQLRRYSKNQNHIKTTLSLKLQQQIERVTQRYIQGKQSTGINNASVMLLNYQTMEVLVELGSADFHSTQIHGQVNGTRAKRSPGSTLKPFVYALALEQGLIHPKSILKDAPKRFSGFTPQNYDQHFIGPVSATEALISSRNIPALSLASQLKPVDLLELLKNANVNHLKSQQHYGLSLVLGGAELTMKELVELYASLANQGVWQPAIEAYPAANKTTATRLLSPEASFLVLDMLAQNPPTNKRLVSPSFYTQPVAWKTGTSFAFRDAWSIGVVGPYVLAVWVGNFDGSSNPAFVGRSAAGELFFRIIDQLRLNTHEGGLTFNDMGLVPESSLNLTKVALCKRTGDLPNQYCPKTTSGWFIPGRSPVKLSLVHRPVYINKRTGERECFFVEGRDELRVFEFWPSDISNIFKQAGLAPKTPPPYKAGCNDHLIATRGKAPEITSLISGNTYLVRDQQPSPIILSANSDANVTSLYWFAGTHYLGKSNPSESFAWSATPGDYTIKVVDDRGRSDEQLLSVRLAR